MNIKLLREIQTQILAEPDQFRMDTWNCGTAQCIGGWACTLTGTRWKKPSEDEWGSLILADTPENSDWPMCNVYSRVRTVLGLTRLQVDHLCYVEHWPSEFAEQYDATTSRAEKAQIAVARIDAFIACDGHEITDHEDDIIDDIDDEDSNEDLPW